MPLLSLSRWRILNRDASETDVTIVSPVHGVAMHHEGGMWIPVCPKRGGTHFRAVSSLESNISGKTKLPPRWKTLT
jgi:hypothetical protein